MSESSRLLGTMIPMDRSRFAAATRDWLDYAPLAQAGREPLRQGCDGLRRRTIPINVPALPADDRVGTERRLRVGTERRLRTRPVMTMKS